ncbi:MAG: ABC transporter permease [Peptostreptococcaceae bacterium]|nr:ABC transporter permease [Peptostreptococcaceae bacterium]
MNSTVKYILKTVAKAFSLIIALSILTFVLAELSPIDPVKAYVGAESLTSPEQMELIAEKWGLNDPPTTRYFKWITEMARGNMGDSLNFQRPVADVVFTNIANSFLLMFISWILSGIFGFFLGILSAAFRDRWPDKIIRTYCYLLSSTPTFWVGILLLLLFTVKYPIFPNGFSAPMGKITADVTFADKIHHLILPALTLSLIGVSSGALHTREKMIDVWNSDYALFAKARGESKFSIIKNHGIRNILLPAVTIQFASISELFGGSVLAENVFSYRGLGSVTVLAGTKGDLPLLLGITMVTGTIVFVGNMIANLLYPVIDPRIKEAKYVEE